MTNICYMWTAASIVTALLPVATLANPKFQRKILGKSFHVHQLRTK